MDPAGAPSAPPPQGGVAGGEVITFYSYKGGTGRTMALVNIACLLAARGQGRVLVVDWDLEAPGLHHYFCDRLTGAFGNAFDRSRRLDQAQGLLDLAAEAGARLDALPAGTPADADALWRGLDLAPYTIATDLDGIDLLKAGRHSESDSAGYARRVAALRWETWFERCPELYPAFARLLAARYRWVLIDARTGNTDTTGICTMLMPDKLVVVFTPNRQSLVGITDLTRRAVHWRARYGEAKPLLVYPLPSRIDSERESLRQQWREGDSAQGIEGYQPLFEQALREAFGLESCSLQTYFNDVQVQHSPDFAFGERIAMAEAGGSTDDRFSIARSYRALLPWLADGVPPWESRERWQALSELIELDERLAAFDDDDVPEIGMRPARIALRSRKRELVAQLHGELAFETLDALHALTAEMADAGQGEQAVEMQGQAALAALVHRDERAIVVLNDLAALHRQLGALDRAQRALRNALEIARDIHGPADLRPLEIEARLGATLAHAGQTAEGWDHVRAAATGLESALGADEPRTLAARAMMAEVLRERGVLESARQEQTRIVEATQRLRGDAHPETWSAITELAVTLARQGQTAQARRLLEPVVAAREVRAPRADATLDAQCHLADVLCREGDLGGARRLLEQVLQTLRATRGHSHLRTIAALTQLGQVVALAGDASAARLMTEQALSLSSQTLGEDHPRTFALLQYLGGLLRNQGDLDGACAIERRVLEQRKNTLGSSHPQTLIAMSRLADSLLAVHRTHEALVLVEGAIELYDRTQPQLPELRAGLTLTAGMIAMTEGQPELAWFAFQRAIDPANGLVGEQHPTRIAAKAAAAPALQAMGRYGEARELLEQVRDTTAEGSSERDRIDESLAVALAREGRTSEGIALLESGLASLQQRLGPTSEAVSQRLRLLVTLAGESGESEAQSRYSEAFVASVKTAFDTPSLKPAAAAARPAQGRRLALCVGIDGYPGHAPLAGAVNDARQWADTLRGLDFEVRLLSDGQATRAAMAQALHELIAQARPGDALVGQFAGLGTQIELAPAGTPDDDPYREMLEALCPVDFADGALLTADDLRGLFLLRPTQTSLTLFVDCGFSGTVARHRLPRVRSRRPRARFVPAGPPTLHAHRRWLAAHGGDPTPPAADPVPPREVLFYAAGRSEAAFETDGHGEFSYHCAALLAASGGKITPRRLLTRLIEAMDGSGLQEPALEAPGDLIDAPLFSVLAA